MNALDDYCKGTWVLVAESGVTCLGSSVRARKLATPHVLSLKLSWRPPEERTRSAAPLSLCETLVVMVRRFWRWVLARQYAAKAKRNPLKYPPDERDHD
jgi:hypothetical protein